MRQVLPVTTFIEQQGKKKNKRNINRKIDESRDHVK